VRRHKRFFDRFNPPDPGNYLGIETPKGHWGDDGLYHPTFLENPQAFQASLADWD